MPLIFDQNRKHKKKIFDPKEYTSGFPTIDTDATRDYPEIGHVPGTSKTYHAAVYEARRDTAEDRRRVGPAMPPRTAPDLDAHAAQRQREEVELDRKRREAETAGGARGRAIAIAAGAGEPIYTAEDARLGQEAGVNTIESAIRREVEKVLAARGTQAEGRAPAPAPAPEPERRGDGARVVFADGTVEERRVAEADRREPTITPDEASQRRAMAELGEALKPDREERRRLNKDYVPRIKAAKTHAEKKRLAHELKERLEGRTTEGMEKREAVAAYSVFEATGVERSAEMEKINKQFNAELNTKIAALQARMVGATGAQTERLQEEFDDLTDQLETAVRGQAKVIEEREAAEAAKDAKSRLLAEKKFTEAKRAGKVREAAAAKKVLDDIDAKIDARTERYQARIDEQAEAEREAAAKVVTAKAKAVTAEKKAAVAATKKVRDDAVTRLTVGVEEFEAQVETDQQIITDAKADLKDLAAVGEDKERVEGEIQYTEIYTNTKKLITDARARIKAMPDRITARKRRISEIETRAPIVEGGFGGSHPPQFEIDSLRAAIIEYGKTGRRRLTAWHMDTWGRLSEKEQAELRALKRKAQGVTE